MNNKDKILKAMISNPNKGNKDLFFTPKSLKEYLFSDLNNDQVELLIKEIIEEKPELIRIVESRFVSGLAILPTGNVDSFLSKGGFTKIEKDNLASEKRISEKDSLEFEKSKIDLRLKRWQLKTFWWFFGIAVLGSVLGIYNFINGSKSTKNTKQEDLMENSVSELPDFSIISDFEKNKAEFTADTLDINDYSTDGGELIAYHKSKAEYIVLDFWLYGETGRLNYTYYTDSDLNFKMVKKLDFEYSKPYTEIDFEIDSTLYYLSYSNSKSKLYDINKKEILKTELINSTKIELEKFFKEVSKGVEIVK